MPCRARAATSPGSPRETEEGSSARPHAHPGRAPGPSAFGSGPALPAGPSRNRPVNRLHNGVRTARGIGPRCKPNTNIETVIEYLAYHGCCLLYQCLMAGFGLEFGVSFRSELLRFRRIGNIQNLYLDGAQIAMQVTQLKNTCSHKGSAQQDAWKQ